MLRQLRPICWNENMPVHAPPLDCSGDCFRYPNCACNFVSKINLSVNRAAVQCLAFAVSSRMSASLIGRFGYTFRRGCCSRASCFSSEFTAFILFCLGIQIVWTGASELLGTSTLQKAVMAMLPVGRRAPVGPIGSGSSALHEAINPRPSRTRFKTHRGAGWRHAHPRETRHSGGGNRD